MERTLLWMSVYVQEHFSLFSYAMHYTHYVIYIPLFFSFVLIIKFSWLFDCTQYNFEFIAIIKGIHELENY